MDFTLFREDSRSPVDDLRDLRVGEVVYLDGVLYTARDKAHKRMLEFLDAGREIPFSPSRGAMFHCGPIVLREGDSYRVLAAGPTTSARMDPFEPRVIRELGVRVVVGKGGMSSEVGRALMEVGGVYLSFTGGCAVKAARAVKEVLGLLWDDLGMAEAVWVFRVEGFGPLIVSMDSAGGDVFKEVEGKGREALRALVEKGGGSR